MLDHSAQYDSKYDLSCTLGSEHSCQGQARTKDDLYSEVRAQAKLLQEAEIEIYGATLT